MFNYDIVKSSHIIFYMNNIANDIFILYRLQILSLASTFYKNETTGEQQFM